MTDTQPKATPPVMGWRFTLIVGASIGLGIGVSRDMAAAWAPRLGAGGAFAASVVIAAVVSGLTALILSWIWNRVGNARMASKNAANAPREL